MGKGIEDFENAPFVLHLYGVPWISYSCGVPSVPNLYAAPLLLYPVFSYLVFVYLFIASLLDYEYAAPLVSYLYMCLSPNELHLKIKLIIKWISYLYNIQIIMKIDI